MGFIGFTVLRDEDLGSFSWVLWECGNLVPELQSLRLWVSFWKIRFQ